MCGIFGVVCFNGGTIDEGLLTKMGRLLTHRGPDAQKIKVYKKEDLTCYLGANRLKILDLSDNANMPMANEDGSIAAVFNGEIYNYQTLKQEQKNRGHLFKTRTDSEVIPHAYEDSGEACFSLFEGMFAAAIWDGLNGRLVLGRDRTGKKPLFYYYDGKHFAFASEIKALLILPFVRKKINENKLAEYFSLGYTNGPGTFYEGIFELMPASFLAIDAEEVNPAEKYWELEYSREDFKPSYTFEDAGLKTKEIIERAVAKRLASDVTLGVLLSGGIDSAIVTGVAASLNRGKLNTFTIGFEKEKSFDERAGARQIARHFGTNHTELSAEVKDISLLEELVKYYDTPCGDPSALPTYLVCKLAKQNVTVALNGDGGDETFAGYDRFKAALLAAKLPGYAFKAGRLATKFIPRSGSYNSLKRKMERFFVAGPSGALERHQKWITIFDGDSLARILKNRISKEETDPGAVYLKKSEKLSLLHKLQYQNFLTYLPGNLNVKMDRMSMANSLETRSPFLDTEVLEFAAQLPAEFKIKGMVSKYILREAYKDMLPKNILSGRKHGFGIPLYAWFNGELGAYFKNNLLDTVPACAKYLDLEYIKELFLEQSTGKYDRSRELWLILQFELWLKKYF